MSKRARRRIALCALLAAGLGACALLAAGCGKEVSLAYDTSPENLIVEVSSSGGLPTPWVDSVPSFRLYGGGKVLKLAREGTHEVLVEGRLNAKQVMAMLEQVRESGFFGLEDKYFDKGVMDGVTVTVAVHLKDETKTVSNYMVKVPKFSRTLEVLRSYPIGKTGTYVPEKGYLVVQREGEAPENPQVPPPEAAALIPPADRLEQAVTDRKAIEVDGQTFTALKEWESTQKYVGADVQVDGTWYKVYPLYKPGRYL